MKKAVKTLLFALTLAGLSATLPAQTAKVADAERQGLIALADRLVGHTGQLAERTRMTGARNRAARTLLTDLNDDALTFRAALRRNRPMDVTAEVAALRESLGQVESRVQARRTDTALRASLQDTAAVLDEMERVTSARGSQTGKASARFEPRAYAEVVDIDRLTTDLVEHAARMRELAQRGGRSAPAIVHFEEQARQVQRVASRRTAVDQRPHVQRLQADLNAALREIRRLGSDEALMTEWEWSDGLLERMGDVGRRATSSRTVPDELLTLSHELHVQMMKAEELARASGRGGDDFARLGDQAYSFHHEMHDGRLSYSEAQDRVESVLRIFQRADGEVGRVRAPAELQAQWRAVAATLERMRALMSV